MEMKSRRGSSSSSAYLKKSASPYYPRTYNTPDLIKGMIEKAELGIVFGVFDLLIIKAM